MVNQTKKCQSLSMFAINLISYVKQEVPKLSTTNVCATPHSLFTRNK